MQMVSKTAGDKASYFGPFGGRSVTQHVIDTLRLTLKLPGCSKQFPRDLGKDRPCLNFHMNNCDGWCQLSRSQQDYHARMEQAVLILQGNYKKVADELRAQMEAAADKLQFELAASLRDRLRAVESLGEKQLVTAGTMANTDVIGYYQNEARACFAVLHYVSGSLLDKEYEILSPADDPQEAVSALVKQFYLARGTAPKVILTPFELEDAELFSALLQQELNKRSSSGCRSAATMSGWSSLRIKTRARRPSASQPEPSAAPARSVRWPICSICRISRTGWRPMIFPTWPGRISSRPWSFSGRQAAQIRL